MNISYSRLTTFMDCPYKFHLRYNEGIRRKAVVRPLSFGSDFHELLEKRTHPEEVAKVLDRIRNDFYGLTPREQEALGEDYPDDVAAVFEEYTNYWKDDVHPDMTEVEFNINLGTYKGEPIIFNGFIDGYFKEPKMIEEHKTFSKKPDNIKLFMNYQTSLYAKAIQQLTGEFPKRIRWDYIKSTPPASPIWLEKSQRFSTAKNDNITVGSFRKACAERGVETSDSLLSAYIGNESNFFFRREVDIYPDMVEKVFSDFKDSIKVLLNSQKMGYKSKNIGQGCSWCDYQDICYGEFTGADVADIIRRDFTIIKKDV